MALGVAEAGCSEKLGVEDGFTQLAAMQSIVSKSAEAGCSEKLDVEDHYVAWRQTHDSPNHGQAVDGPFSFCSFPFLLNPRAKSKLLHAEARCLMTQVTHQLPP